MPYSSVITRRMAGKIRLAADLGAQRRIRGSFSKWYQPAGWRVARPLTAAKHSENSIINPDVVQPAIRRVDAFVTLLPRVCRSLWSLLNSRLTGFNPRRARVVPVLADNNKKNFAISTKTTFKGVFRVVTLHHHETFKHIPLPPLVPQAPHPARIRRHWPPRTPSPPHRPRQHRPHRISRRVRRHQPPAPPLRPVPQQPLLPKLHHPDCHHKRPDSCRRRRNFSLHTPNFTLRAARAPSRTPRPCRS